MEIEVASSNPVGGEILCNHPRKQLLIVLKFFTNLDVLVTMFVIVSYYISVPARNEADRAVFLHKIAVKD